MLGEEECWFDGEDDGSVVGDELGGVEGGFDGDNVGLRVSHLSDVQLIFLSQPHPLPQHAPLSSSATEHNLIPCFSQ